MREKGFSAILILVGLFIIAGMIISGAYYLRNKPQSQKSAITPKISQTSPDKTTNWKTYISPQGDYRFQYPSEWVIVEDPLAGETSVKLDNQKDNSSVEAISIVISSGTYNITEEEFTNPQSLLVFRN